MDLFSDTDPVFLHRDLCAGCYGAGFIKDKGESDQQYFMVGMTVPVQVSILPITKSVIFTMALITAIGQWNDFYMPMVLPGDKNVTTLTLAIYRYVGQFTKYKSGFMAAVVITLIPIIILYFAFFSRIVEGLTGGAVK